MHNTTYHDEKHKHDAEQLTGSVLVQEYHVMIQEGLEYSYITTGLAFVLLRDDPKTLDCYNKPGLKLPDRDSVGCFQSDAIDR
jgi:hypothetical protein